MTISAAEQYMLELINRARLDPVSEARRQGIDLNKDLAAGTIGTLPKQVLAMNAALSLAAERHSKWMIDANVFSHTGANGSTHTARITAAGYELTGTWRTGENIALSASGGTISLNREITVHHNGLWASAGHRVNMMRDDYREIGIAQEAGRFTTGGATYNASLLTQNYGRRST